MKKLIAYATGLLMAGACLAQSFTTEPLVLESASTNFTSGDTDTSGSCRGFIEGIELKLYNTTQYRVCASNGTFTPDPDVSGYYSASGTYSGQTAYVRTDGDYWMWYDGVASNYISETKGMGTNKAWFAQTNGAGDRWIATNFYDRTDIAVTGVLTVMISSNNVDIDIATVANHGLGVARSILSLDDVTTNGYYAIRIPATDTSGTWGGPTNWVRIPLDGDYLSMTAYDATNLYGTVEARIVITP